MADITNNASNSKHEFTMNYSERELSCWVEKEDNILHVHIDNNTKVDLELQPDGSLKQISGPTLPDSNIDYIRRIVLTNDGPDSGQGSGI
jgi:hypothetical protein